MSPYHFIDHTADVAVELSGRTVDELFRSAAQALTDTVTERSLVVEIQTETVSLEATSIEDLLVDWLNELLYRFEVRNLLVADADVSLRTEGDRWHLDATVRGEDFDPVRHPSRVLVKSATYHSLEVVERGGEWHARIVFDV
jgi:SHS2 domain-containing protein